MYVKQERRDRQDSQWIEIERKKNGFKIGYEMDTVQNMQCVLADAPEVW